MTQISVRGDTAPGVVRACADLGLPAPTSVNIPLTVGNATVTWTPDLTAPQQAVVDSVVKLAIGSTLVTKAERDSIEPQLATLRTFQQQSQSEFIALTQNARDRALFDTTTALIRVVRIFLRD